MLCSCDHFEPECCVVVTTLSPSFVVSDHFKTKLCGSCGHFEPDFCGSREHFDPELCGSCCRGHFEFTFCGSCEHLGPN